MRKRIRDTLEPQEAMEIASRLNREAQLFYKLEGFQKDEYNLEVMFHITLAKFRQNPKLCKWLLDTDRDRKDTPIFHVRDQDPFFAIGELKEDGMYHGKNWNGVILMIVRSILAREVGISRPSLDEGESVAERFPRDPFPPLGAPADHGRQGVEMVQGFKALLQSMRRNHAIQQQARSGGTATALPIGTLIAQRYRVLDSMDTGGRPLIMTQTTPKCTQQPETLYPLHTKLKMR